MTSVTLVSGYLGAGKTTFINSVLRNAGSKRLAVLVNDFGDLPIDADLIDGRDDNLISISGGCICCSFGDDLSATLLELSQSKRKLDHFLIETSGVALPLPLVRSLRLIPGLAIEGVITIADSETIKSNTAKRYIGDTVRQQLEAADLLVLNKADLVSSDRLQQLRDWFNTTFSNIPIIATTNAAIPLDVVLGVGGSRFANMELSPWICHETANYTAVSVTSQHRCDIEALTRDLLSANIDVLRVKGFVQDLDGTFQILQMVGRRTYSQVSPEKAEKGSTLVCIALADRISHSDLEYMIRRHFHAANA